MLINMRNAMMAGGWKNPYVTDGLVAMWDGEWNAGGGIHAPNAISWVDLSGNGHNLEVLSPLHWYNSYALIDGSGCAAKLNVPLYTYKTVEAVIRIEDLEHDGELKMQMVMSGGFKSNNNPIGIMVNAYYSNSYTIQWNAPSGEYTKKTHIGSYAQFDGVPFYTAASCSDFRNSLISEGYLNGEIATSVVEHINGASGSGILVVGAQSLRNGRPMRGRIYALRLYSKELTAGELAANYAVDKARFNLPDAT